MPEIAWDALEAGYDGVAVCQMAALQHPSGWETDTLLSQFLIDTGMKLLTKREASLQLAYDVAREIIDNRKDLLSDLPFFAKLCSEADYLTELVGLYQLDDEIYNNESIFGRTLDQARSDVRDELITLIRNHDQMVRS